MDAIEALKTRRSVRAFTAVPVSRRIVEDIVDCGRLAPSAGNVQPIEFVVVADHAVKGRIAGLTDHGEHLADAPVCILVIARSTKYYVEDGSAATENILVAARAHGLGSCWIAGGKKPYAAAVCREVGAPEEFELVSVVAIGYSEESPWPPKRPLAEVLHWGRFGERPT